MIIVVNEYPKSGGTWLCSLLGDYLNYKKRDIYMNDSNIDSVKTLNRREHPWFKGESSIAIVDNSIVKSHEPHGSDLLKEYNNIVHLIRDGRDVMVSRYYFESDYLLKNEVIDKFEYTFTSFLEKTAKEWNDFINGWIHTNALTVRYENMKNDEREVLIKIIDYLGLSHPDVANLEMAVKRNTIEGMRAQRQGVAKHDTFIRKGVVGDWKNHFSTKEKDIFKEIAGNILIELGYEKDNNW